ncbi:RICIN domain-containing protein [Streptomyces sp. UNOB3_S3]|uniref:RICIN domain-containing protein n=1 Tax=Streptomyces sp. UNOB3_S3 TaxID=2871682 RepID=UPI001E40607C|nr:RICIN domain-containing protein [Streptomyces sp. UNOB3_S3]MCC3776135.1 RICIN domain-containing protein [Streptomyces sp. UNOB3_S3]
MRTTVRRSVRRSAAVLFAAAGITAGLALPATAAGTAVPAAPAAVTQQAQPKAAAAQQLAGLQGNQMWKLRKKGGNYEIANSHSDLCLKVRGGSTDNGAPIVQDECGTAAEKLWKAEVTDGGTYIQLRNAYSSKCLTIDGNRAVRGAKIIQWDCFGGLGQKWWDTDGINSDQGWWISGGTPSSAPTWMCLDMPGWSTGSGTQAAVWECTS